MLKDGCFTTILQYNGMVTMGLKPDDDADDQLASFSA